MRKRRIVRVLWNDACTTNGSYTKGFLNEETGLVKSETIGELILENKEVVKVGSFIQEGRLVHLDGSEVIEDVYRAVHIIPKGCVEKIVNLKE